MFDFRTFRGQFWGAIKLRNFEALCQSVNRVQGRLLSFVCLLLLLFIVANLDPPPPPVSGKVAMDDLNKLGRIEATEAGKLSVRGTTNNERG